MGSHDLVSSSFLGLTAAGFALLCSSLLVLVFT
ncbi:hypothetical protein ACVIQY_002437 [Bradyrhizobium sp. USDA 3051]